MARHGGLSAAATVTRNRKQISKLSEARLPKSLEGSELRSRGRGPVLPRARDSTPLSAGEGRVAAAGRREAGPDEGADAHTAGGAADCPRGPGEAPTTAVTGAVRFRERPQIAAGAPHVCAQGRARIATAGFLKSKCYKKGLRALSSVSGSGARPSGRRAQFEWGVPARVRGSRGAALRQLSSNCAVPRKQARPPPRSATAPLRVRAPSKGPQGSQGLPLEVGLRLNRKGPSGCRNQLWGREGSPAPRYYPEELETGVQANTCTQIFTAVCLRQPKGGKKRHQLMDKMCHMCILTTECYSATKRKEVLMHATTPMSLENIMQNTKSHERPHIV
ncbi:uncharacterized protein LOC123631998 [Lemur catta]|uniref:uncharacterized protein LOC123631998 n=1 Tax=Lemur catta TaxID=9447 RepID=UPI001E26D63B|nr:uncharacterized protein LOC123631998 [Lemur catta]